MTYGRIDLLEESLYSFLNQNYEGDSELVIVNDYPLQNIIFDHPKVRIYNINHTFETIGDKENFSAENFALFPIISFNRNIDMLPLYSFTSVLVLYKILVTRKIWRRKCI
jgi:hypothetical protein